MFPMPVVVAWEIFIKRTTFGKGMVNMYYMTYGYPLSVSVTRDEVIEGYEIERKIGEIVKLNKDELVLWAELQTPKEIEENELLRRLQTKNLLISDETMSKLFSGIELFQPIRQGLGCALMIDESSNTSCYGLQLGQQKFGVTVMQKDIWNMADGNNNIWDIANKVCAKHHINHSDVQQEINKLMLAGFLYLRANY